MGLRFNDPGMKVEDLCDLVVPTHAPVSLPMSYELRVLPPFRFFDRTGLRRTRRHLRFCLSSLAGKAVITEVKGGADRKRGGSAEELLAGGAGEHQ
jgi:hypothetical protein